MKHTKKKRKQKPSISKSTQSSHRQNPNPNFTPNFTPNCNPFTPNCNPNEIGNESNVLNNLNHVTEQFASFSVDETSSSTSANDALEIFGSLTETGSSSSGSSGLSNFDGFKCEVIGKGGKGGRGSKVIAATGMVSGLIGKDYVPTVNKKRAFAKWKGNGNGDDDVSREEAEQFLCSMLSEDCEFGMDLVKDVLCQTAYDVERALDILLELTSSSSELNENGRHENVDAKCKDTRSFLEASDTFTDRTSDLASSSASDFNMGYNRRNYFEVLSGHGTDPPPAPKNASELTQDVLESLFSSKKSSKHEPGNMNWRNVVKKMESFGQMLDYPSEDTEKKLPDPAKGEDYHAYRNSASQHWDSMKTYYHKAATAYASGNREYAAYLSDKGRMSNEKARKADERASHDIFSSRNKDIENMITIDLHGQHVKQGMKLLKLHLLFGAYVRSVRLFRVITGCGSHGLGKSKLKQSVVNLLETEKIDWKEENKGTLLIKLNGQREFSFLDSGSDSE